MLTRAQDWAFALASGILLILSFPKFGHPAIAWIALTPLVVVLTTRMSMPRAFGLGLLTGTVYLGGTLYWLTGVMRAYGGFESWAGPAFGFVLAVLLNFAFVAYLALYPALFAVVMRRLTMGFGASALVAAPFVWTATELGRMYIFTGFPWVLLGYSQATVLPIAQAASVLGVFGVSAIVASVSAALAGVVVTRAWKPAAAVVASVLLIAVWGNARARDAALTREGQPLRVAVVQPNVPQEERDLPGSGAAIFQRDLVMIRQALTERVSLVVLPESALSPYTFDDYPTVSGPLRQLARESGAAILLGSDQYAGWRKTASGAQPEKSYNAAFMLRGDGTTGAVYRKMHLVPWGEYVPLKQWLTFVGPLVQAIGSGFDKGDQMTLLPVGAHQVSTAICYEIIYPDLVRRFVVAGSELVTTITNDSWFGPTSAPYQHFEQASMRAIEDGRYLVRAANTGVSGIVDPYGHVLLRTDIYKPAVISGEVRLLKTLTIYARIGDIFAYASVVLTAALVLMTRRRRLMTGD